MIFKEKLLNRNSVSTAKSSLIKGSSCKINAILKLIRGKPVLSAVSLLNRTQKYAAVDVRKTLLSAISNAENKGFFDSDNLIVKHVSVGKAINLRRFHTRARGRIFAINKHYCKVYVELHELVRS